MTANSVIANFIQSHPDTWEADLLRKGIKTHYEGPYAIFNYGIACDFSDPVVQEARGIILRTDTLDVVCWPFRKFGNWNEPYADEIDWKTARVQEKIDGSIVKLWWDGEAWTWSTNGVIRAEYASVANGTGIYANYLGLIQNAENYSQILFDELDKGMTYIFELVSPFNEVVVHHSSVVLWHIGTRDNHTGQECNVDIGIRKPREYAISTFDECLEAAKKLNPTKGVITQEGYVVVDGSWNRIKVKSSAYLAVHHMLGNGVITKEKALDIIEHGLQNEVRDYPQAYAVVKWYEYQLAEFELDVANYIAYVRGLYDEVERSRKAVAVAIKTDLYAPFGFRSLGNDKTAKMLIEECQRGAWIKHIQDYQRRKPDEKF